MDLTVWREKNIVDCENMEELLQNISLVDFFDTTYEHMYINTDKYHFKDYSNYYDNVVFDGNIYIGKNVTIQPFVTIIGPVYIMDNVFIGSGSLIRENTFIGENSVIGFNNEVSNSIILRNSMISHFSNVSRSLIGSDVTLNSHTTLMTTLLGSMEESTAYKNGLIFKGFGKPEDYTGLKFGSIIGDSCKIGAYVSVNPGSVLDRNVVIYPGIVLPTNRYLANRKIYIESYSSKIREKEFNEN